MDVYNYLQYPFGNDTDWMRSDMLNDRTSVTNYNNWLQQFVLFTQDTSGGGAFISLNESATLLSMPLYLNEAVQTTLIQRYNRTLNYWDSNINNAVDVTGSESVDFVEKGVLATLIQKAAYAQQQAINQGYNNWVEAYNFAVQTFNQVSCEQELIDQLHSSN